MLYQVDSTTSLLAMYGAVISTVSLLIALFLGLIEYRRERVHVKVEIDRGSVGFGDGLWSEPFILVKAVNSGKGGVKLNSFGFLLEGGRKHQLINLYTLELPAMLEERSSLTAYYAVRWFQETPERDEYIGAYFTDDTGKMWKGSLSPIERRKLIELNTDSGIKIEWSQKLELFYRSDIPDPMGLLKEE